MAIAGRVAIVPKGDWSAETEYKRLDEVTYNNTMFIAKKLCRRGRYPQMQNIGRSRLWVVSVQSQRKRMPEL